MGNIRRDDREDSRGLISRSREKSRRLEVYSFLSLQLIAWLLFDGLLLVLLHGSRSNWEVQVPLLAVLLGAVAAQLSVTAGWWVVGDGPWMVRLAMVFAASVLAAFCLWATEGFHDPVFFLLGIVMTFPVAVGMALPLGVFRFFGIACRSTGSNAPSETTPAGVQFRVRDLMVITALVAIAFGALRLLPEHDFEQVLYTLMTAPIVGSFVGFVPWLLWMAILKLREEYAWTVVAVVTVALCVLYFLLGFVDAGPASMPLGVLVAPTFVFTVALHLFILRYLGYRLVRLPVRPGGTK